MNGCVPIVDITLRSVRAYCCKFYSLTFFLVRTFIARSFLSDLRSIRKTSPKDPLPSSW